MRQIALLLLLFPFLLPVFLHAQEVGDNYEIDRILFVGNTTFDDTELKNILQSRETPSWIWKTLYSISEKLGEKAEYYDPIAFDADFHILKNYYEDQGFFHTTIDTAIRFDNDGKRVTLTFAIQEGMRSYIDSLRYEGIAGLPSELLEEIQGKRLLEVGDPFLKQRISDEVRRTLAAFLNFGYVNVQIDRPEALRYTSTNNISVVFMFHPDGRYRFGAIDIQQDTSVIEQVETEVILRHLDFAQGDFYSEEKKVESERNLNRLGVFERVQIEHSLEELPDSSTDLPMRVTVRPRSFHELSPELGVNDEKNAFNLQFGIGYNNRNFLGGARNLSTRLRLSLQSIQDLNFGGVFGSNGLRDTTLISTVEFSTQMIQPFFLTNKVSLIWSISALVEKEKYYSLPVLRNRIGFNWHQAQFTRIFIDWNLERISFSPLVADIDSSLVRNLTYDRTPQFNSVVTFTMQRDKRNDLFSPSSGFFHSGTIEESGFLPSISGGLFGTDLPYSRYVKLSVVGQWYWDPGQDRRLIWALKARGGFAELYDNSPAPVPLPRRFFGGGSGSVRGWKARTLGARLGDPSEGGTASFEANLEARWHLFKNAGRLWFLELPKLSLVFFYDAGNVWADIKNVRVKEIAMAAGFGIRFDTIAGPLRIDYGFRTFDPFAPMGQQWVTERRFFPETFSNGVLHFGVGHAF